MISEEKLKRLQSNARQTNMKLNDIYYMLGKKGLRCEDFTPCPLGMIDSFLLPLQRRITKVGSSHCTDRCRYFLFRKGDVGSDVYCAGLLQEPYLKIKKETK